MRLTKVFTKTSKNIPSDEVSKNAQLLIKAGFISKDMAGVYTYLPLGLKVLNKIANIVRQEMNAVDGQEVLMPALQLKERYQKTGRWSDEVVDDWFKTKLVNGSELGLGFSHEENITPIIKNFVNSYKDLPVSAYQIQTKFRNEARSKSGLMRGREFLMKDMYSFALNQQQHQEYYERVAKAYKKVFKRLGIGDQTVRVTASGGSYSKYSHEFQAICQAGEDTIFQLSNGEFFNREIAPSKVARANKKEPLQELQEVIAKGIVGVDALIKHLGIAIEKSTKTIFYATEKSEIIVAAVRSDYEINELKLCEAASAVKLRLATEQEVLELTGAKNGYAGLINLPTSVRVFIDDSLQGLHNFETGANKTDFHVVNANFDRDIANPEKFYDIKIARIGDLDPATNQPMTTHKAIEVGNIFSLGIRFSRAFDVTVMDESGEQITPIMGCYGIGIGRAMGTIAELLSDDSGLNWPESVAPAKVYLAPLGDNPEVIKQADELYEDFLSSGIEVIYDDRPNARPGQKFADADLLGVPYRVVISEKLVKQSKYELKKRASNITNVVNKKDLLAKIGN